jgi:hypothetical protein
MPVFKLQYFDAKGIIEPARILLALAGQEFEDGRFPIVFGTPVTRCDAKSVVTLSHGAAYHFNSGRS